MFEDQDFDAIWKHIEHNSDVSQSRLKAAADDTGVPLDVLAVGVGVFVTHANERGEGYWEFDGTALKYAIPAMFRRAGRAIDEETSHQLRVDALDAFILDPLVSEPCLALALAYSSVAAKL